MEQRPKAYVFDIFGTVVNWRYSLAKGLEASAQKIIDESAFSDVDEAVLARARDMTFSDWEWFAFQWSVLSLAVVVSHTLDAYSGPGIRDTSTPARGPRTAKSRERRRLSTKRSCIGAI